MAKVDSFYLQVTVEELDKLIKELVRIRDGREEDSKRSINIISYVVDLGDFEFDLEILK